jgi:CheY-like chemotaxis protein
MASDNKDISCRVVQTLLMYVRHRCNGSLIGLLEGLELDEAYLQDANNWISHSFIQTLYHRMIEITGDDKAVRMLSKLGYKVTAVSSGEEAVAYMQTHTVDLLLLDMIMDPGIDGLETYQRILEKHPRQKIVIVSGYSESKRVKTLQELGAVLMSKNLILLRALAWRFAAS